MIIKKFEVNNRYKPYYIGINQIQFNPQNIPFDQIIQIIDDYQETNHDITMQILNDKYVLNTEHIYNACYFLQKAFLYNTNISMKRNIELLLYLAANRQIKVAIEDFGINFNLYKSGLINICMISSKNNLYEENLEFIRTINAKEIRITLDQFSFDKFKTIKTYFKISDNQIYSVLNSYGIKLKTISNKAIKELYLALNDLICEKMTLLNLEKFSKS